MKFRPYATSLAESLIGLVELPATKEALTSHINKLYFVNKEGLAAKDLEVKASGYNPQLSDWKVHEINTSPFVAAALSLPTIGDKALYNTFIVFGPLNGELKVFGYIDEPFN